MMSRMKRQATGRSRNAREVEGRLGVAPRPGGGAGVVDGFPSARSLRQLSPSTCKVVCSTQSNTALRSHCSHASTTEMLEIDPRRVVLWVGCYTEEDSKKYHGQYITREETKTAERDGGRRRMRERRVPRPNPIARRVSALRRRVSESSQTSEHSENVPGKGGGEPGAKPCRRRPVGTRIASARPFL